MTAVKKKDMLSVFFKGFLLYAGIIIGVGAQNTWVLTQGIRKKYYIIIPVICSVIDSALLTVGILGIGAILFSVPVIARIITAAGIMFLTIYGFLRFRRIFKPEKAKTTESSPLSLKSAVMITLAVSLLNPHSYIDAFIVIGNAGSAYNTPEQYLFTLGTICASVLWFFLLSFGGKTMSALFKCSVAWKILDAAAGIIMWAIAFSLLRQMI